MVFFFLERHKSIAVVRELNKANFDVFSVFSHFENFYTVDRTKDLVALIKMVRFDYVIPMQILEVNQNYW